MLVRSRPAKAEHWQRKPPTAVLFGETKMADAMNEAALLDALHAVKREVQSDGEGCAAEVQRRQSVGVSPVTEPVADELRVSYRCRGRGDFSIMTRVSSGTLYGLLDTFFRQCDGGLAQQIYSHSWHLQLKGKIYAGPFDGCAVCVPGYLENIVECTDSNPISLRSIGLQSGDTGTFKGCEEFSFAVEKVHPTPQQTAAASTAAAPAAAPVVGPKEPAQAAQKAASARRQATKHAKPVKTAKQTSGGEWLLTAELFDGAVRVSTRHATVAAAAKAAWELSEEHTLEMPSTEWWTMHRRYGEQECYNAMVRTDGDEWDPRTEFMVYVKKAAKWPEGFKMRNGKDFVTLVRCPEEVPSRGAPMSEGVTKRQKVQR
jgi:hypothetical protein